MIAIVPALLSTAAYALEASEQVPAQVPDRDFNAFLAVLAMVVAAAVLFLIGAGIVVAAMIAAALAVLVTLGILTTSTLVGVARRRVSSGLRALHYQAFAALGILPGIGMLGLCSKLFSLQLGFWNVGIIGALVGLCAGLFLAFMVDRIITFACRRILARAGNSIS